MIARIAARLSYEPNTWHNRRPLVFQMALGAGFLRCWWGEGLKA